MTRAEVLEMAKTCVLGNREEDYGTPEQNFQIIAEFWNSYLGLDGNYISGKDVAAMLALLKIARIRSGKSKSDNWVDLAGYAACGAEVEETELKNLED